MDCEQILIKFLASFLALIAVPIYLVLLWIPHEIYNYFSIYRPDFFRRRNTPENHDKKVKRVQDQVMRWNQAGRKTRMCTARPAWKTVSMRYIDKGKLTQIKLDMEDVIEIDIDRQIIRVEPGIQMGTLTYKLVPLGWTIPVVPEFEILTVGGLINGAGLESSSHKYGIFATTCLEYELVLADGSVVTCSEKENSDLFYAVPMSYGTLGFMTSVTLPLIPAGKYVRLEYHASHSIASTEELLQRREHDFIEGIAFSQNKAIVTLGDFSQLAESGKINTINRWYKQFFYLHAKSFLNKNKPKVEFIPTRDYYHRHTRGYFWGPVGVPIGTTFLFRFLFGWILPINIQVVKAIAPQPKCIIDFAVTLGFAQDFVVSIETLEESLKLCHNMTGIYPLWLCPSAGNDRPGLVHLQNATKSYYVDVGVYGMPARQKRKAMGGSCVAAVKAFENFAVKNNGFQGMYADCYMSRDEFYTMFDPTLYYRMRDELHCTDAFPDLYEKISVYHKKN